MKTGLVLEGGSLRGLYTCGITDVFLENDISFDGVIGVSAGAAFGCNYKSKQAGRAIRYNKRYARDPRYSSFSSLLLTGNLYNAEFCYHTMPTKLDVFDLETYRSNPTEFWIVVTEYETAQGVYKRLDDGGYEDMEWLRASASLPVAAQPVELDGKLYMDGGIADSIPLEFFESQGFEKNIVILTQPKGFQKPVQKGLPIIELFIRDTPAICAKIEDRHIRYNEQTAYVAKRAAEGDVLAIYPDEPLDIGVFNHNPNDMQRIYDIGRAVGEKYLPQVREFLQ